MVRWNGGAPAVCASGWRGPECGFTDAERRKGEMGGPIEWSFRILQFSWGTSRQRMDPATFATELGILAVRGFGDMMIRDKFIAAQRHCGLRRHLDGVPPDTPIWEIVDGRLWESHSDREPSSADDQDLDSRRQSDDPRKLECPRTGSQNNEEDGQLAPLQAISLLVAQLL